MSRGDPEGADRNEGRKGRKIAGIVALLLLLLLLLFVPWRCSIWGTASNRGNGPSIGTERRDSASVADSLDRLRARQDSLRRCDSARLADSLARLRAAERADRRHRDALRLSRLADSLARARLELQRRADSLRILDSLARLRKAHSDTLPPHVYADPAAGIHEAPVEVAVLSEEPGVVPLCGPDSSRMRECRDLVRITDRAVLWISGIDTAGNRARPQRLEYVIDPDASRCGPRRVLVTPEPPMDGSAPDPSFCLDAFEYPNDPNGLPRTSVNWEEASAMCAKAGKRLCSARELEEACRGPKGWDYPYGSGYIPGHCQDAEGSLTRGMSRPACRSWFGAFHLTGNAWEWTSTPSGSTFLASGGTFSDGPEDRCGRTTRSFFRQNRYEAVGFRCCAKAPED